MRVLLKIRKYRADYNNNPPNSISFIPAITSTSGRLPCDIVNLCVFYFYKLIGKLTAFLQLQEFNLRNLKCFCSFSTLTKVATLRVNLNLDGVPITSKSHTHPSHSQSSRLKTSSLSLGVPVPRETQCMQVV